MDVIIVIIFILALTAFIINAVSHNFKIASTGYLWGLFSMHFLLTLAYIISATFSSSDSVQYYKKASETLQWFDLWNTGTMFISFCGWVFAHLMNLSYYSVMLIFSFFGFLASLLLYITAKENITLNPVWNRMT